MTKQEEILRILADRALLNTGQIPVILQETADQGARLDDVLIKRRVLDEESLAQVKAQVYGLPYENLHGKEIKEEVVQTIASEVAENYRIICFDRTGDIIKIGLIDPENFKAVEAVDFLAKGKGLTTQFYLISNKSFRDGFKRYKAMDKELDTALKAREEEEEVLTIKKEEAADLDEVTKSAPVAKIVSVIIRHAVEGGASDIHIEPLLKESRVRYRIDGILHTSLVLPRSVHPALVARIKVLANLKLDETRVPQDGRIRMEISDKVIDFRVSTLPLIGAEKVVMRILDTTRGAPKLEELGYEGQQLEAIKKATEKTEGIILITGPTGSGKSTTIFSVLDILNREAVNIATLEDPVEYQMKGVNQSQVKPEIGYTFASGLRSFLRQDPDIIMVGEIRDEETAELAIHAALTGHLVLSTLHTTDSPGAITRLTDMKVKPFLLGSTLVCVVAQRLARKICANCKEEIKLPEPYIAEIKEDIKKIGLDYVKKLIPDFDIEKMKFYKGKGCSHCGNTGYAGRLSVAETLTISDRIKEQILAGERALKIEDIKADQTFITVKQDGILKAVQGITTFEEVLRVMRD